MTSPSPSPRLPPELERDIFLLALEDDPSEKKNWALIAKRVFEWLIPKIYNVVRLSTRMYTPIRFNESAYRRYGHHTRHLLIEANEYREYLHLFPNIINLAFWADFDEIHVASLLRLQLQLTAISTQPLEVFFPIFMNVTHLDLVHEFDWTVTEALYFPKLTHLCLIDVSTKENMELFLDRRGCPELRVLIIWTWGLCVPELNEEHESIVDDKRVVVIRCNGSTDWERGVRGEVDSWRFAEGIVARRK